MTVGRSVVGWWAKNTLSCMSLSSRVVVGVRFCVVYGSVQMNFIPSRRTDFASGGTIFVCVRSWKATLDLEKYCADGVVHMLLTALWNGEQVGFRWRLHRLSYVPMSDVWMH